MSEELARKLRPKTLDEIIGQPAAVRALKAMVKDGVPHVLRLHGQTGGGKTTAALIMAEHLGATGTDLQHLNCADVRGIDAARELINEMRTYGMSKGGKRVYIVEECHRLTRDAIEALLVPLDTPPDHVYFIFTTTEPNALPKTFHNRGEKVEFKAVPAGELEAYLIKAGKEIKYVPSASVLGALVEKAEGSVREALVRLEGCARLKDDEERLKYLETAEESPQVIELCRSLIYATDWAKVAKLLQGLTEEPETVRAIVLSYMQKVLLSGKPDAAKAAKIMHAFREPLFHKATARAFLTLACFDAIFRSK